MELKGKTALVTGGGRRVGRAIGLALGRGGADVILHFNRSADAAEATAGDIRALGARAEVVQADLADPAAIETMFAAIADKWGRLDILVNNAAIFERTSLDELTAEQWDALMAVNARAPALCMVAAAKLMTDGGSIVNITDTSAERPWGGYAAYCAAKAALNALTKSAARALASQNIRVNAVAPGVVAWDDDTEPDQRQAVLDQVPLRRSGSAEDVAAATVFLATSDYITGQVLRVDGGWNMR